MIPATANHTAALFDGIAPVYDRVNTVVSMGTDRFWAGIRDYLATYRFKLGSTKALLDTLYRHTSLDLVPRYEPRFPGLY